MAAMRLRATYATHDDLARDVREQLGKGGLLVRGATAVEMYAQVELEIACAGASTVVPATVLQAFPGLGVAVSVDGTARAAIESLLTRVAAPAEAPSPGPSVAHAPTAPAADRPAAASLAKIEQALRGTRDERMAVLRSPQRNLHVYVLRNPGLTLDEIAGMARMTTISVDVLKQIAERREWGHRPEIAIALVRNPTVPPPVAVALLDHVAPAELRQLAKDARTREAIQKAARKKLLGSG